MSVCSSLQANTRVNSDSAHSSIIYELYKYLFVLYLLFHGVSVLLSITSSVPNFQVNTNRPTAGKKKEKNAGIC